MQVIRTEDGAIGRSRIMENLEDHFQKFSFYSRAKDLSSPKKRDDSSLGRLWLGETSMGARK